MKGFSEEE